MVWFMANLYEEGQDVQILSGEYQGRVATVSRMASINGLFQYGLEGITETEGHLYAVHENEITDRIDRSLDNPPLDEPEIIPPSSSSITEPQLGEADNVSSLLQKASQVAQGRELEFNQALQGILAKLEQIDQRLETKEIKVIVEVQHVYPEKPDTNKTGEVKWHNDMPPTYSDEDRLYDSVEAVEEIADKARSRISDFNGHMLDDEENPQLTIKGLYIDQYNEEE